MGDAEGQFAQSGHLLGVNFLFALSFVARVSLSDGFQALAQPFARCMLLGVSEQLVGLGADLAAFIIGQLITHLLDEYQQRPPCALTISTPFSDPPRPFDNWFCLLLMIQAA